METNRYKNTTKLEILHPCEENRPQWEPHTMFDEIKSFNKDQLANFIYKLAYARETPWDDEFKKTFCDKCPTTKCITETGAVLELCECDFSDGKCPHGDPVLWWLSSSTEKSANNN